MRLKRNYLNVIKRKQDWLLSRFKPLTIHTESIMVDSVWEKIKEKVIEGKVKKWYVMTPANINYFKSDFNVDLSKKKLSQILEERYNWMLRKGQKLELHLHLSMIMENISYSEQEKLFKGSLGWMENKLKIKVREFVPGWWAFNEDTKKICEKFGLKMIFPRDYDFIHDFDLISK